MQELGEVNSVKKLELMVKPTQSGKTFLMLQEISSLWEKNSDIIHIIFCDNQLLQTEQTSSRIKHFDDFDEYKLNDGEISLIFSSKGIKDYKQIIHHIIFNGIKSIITCSNRKRISDIDILLNEYSKILTYNYCIWIDEIDKNIKLFCKYINKWKDMEKVKRIDLITATPLNVFNNFNLIKIYGLDETYDKEKFHCFQHSNFKICDNNYETLEYITNILDEYKNDLKNGQVWFVPGDINKNSHLEIKNILIKHNFIVFVINGTCKQIFYEDNTFEDIPINNIDTLANVLGKLYIEKNFKNKKIAITGNLCVSRGITISSENMIITHAILPTKISNSNSCNMYQLAGRICGNIKKFKNYKNPTIFCTENFKKIVSKCETQAINLAEKAFQLNNNIITKKDFDLAINGIMNTGIPIKLNINNQDYLNYIQTIKKLDDRRREILEHIIKKQELQNYNNDFNINEYKLRNKYLINKDDVDKDGKSHYEYNNFVSHFSNRSCKEPNKNCNKGEYLIYIIVDDIPQWKAIKGDAIIVYRPK